MKNICLTLLFATPILAWSPDATAWGPTGHAVIGQAALEQLSPPARAAATRVLGVPPGVSADRALDEACNWPDQVRETPEWAWSAPLHFVNLPRSDPGYDRQRDCPDGLCVTEGILRYAAALAQPAAPAPPAAGPQDSTRWQSLAWLCHLVGDLHQPLHAGFLDDRGGNRVEIRYRGNAYNLHEFWDSVLVQERWEPNRRLPPAIDASRVAFEPGRVAQWTEESHRLAIEAAYPEDPDISEDFANRSWVLIQQRWALAAARLAAILEVVLAPPAE